MAIEILSSSYREGFIDQSKYSGRVSNHLAGLASAIEDSHDDWRPTVSELLGLLPRAESTNAIVAAGMSYGAAKSIGDDYPGPAILLYGAALNVIGSAPNVELNAAIARSKDKLNEYSLMEDHDIREIIEAAKQRASFDKVSQMLRNEFASGLKDSGRFDDELIADVVPKIVNVTHDVRHKGLIERILWKNLVIEVGGTSTDAGYMHEIDEVVFTDDLLRELIVYAQVGCAFSILQRMEERRAPF